MKHQTISHGNSAILARIFETIQAFWTGFVQPTRFALLLMIATFTAGALAMGLGITPSTLAGRLGDYIPSNFADSDAFLTVRMFRMAEDKTPPDSNPNLYAVGDSLLAHAFASETGLEAALQTTTGRKWHAAMLTTPQQMVLDSSALIDVATKKDPGIVVMAFGAGRLTADKAGELHSYRLARLGFRSKWQDEQVRLLGEKPRRVTGNYVMDNRNFLLRNTADAVRNLLYFGPPVRRIDAYTIGIHLSPKEWETFHDTVLSDLRNAASHPNPTTIRLLEDTARRLEARGNKLIIFEPPISDRTFTRQSDRRDYQNYLKLAAQLTARLGGYYCFPSDVHPPVSAFADFHHVTDPYWQGRLRVALAKCVEDATTSKGKQS